MAMKIQKHHSEHLDGTKGRYRIALVAGKLTGPDGHPLSHDDIVVISCPACGAPQGIGADDVKIVDGKTDRVWRCYGGPRGECKATVDSMEFESHTEPHVREEIAKHKEKAMNDIAESRINVAIDLHHANTRAELNERVDAEVRAMFGSDGHKDAALYNKVIADLKKKQKK